MSEKDLRWEQRFSNFNKALAKLKEVVTKIKKEYPENKEIVQSDFIFGFDIIKEGLIQRFEYTHELAWNVMKDYATYQGNPSVGGSRDAVREAFQMQLIKDGQVWMDMIKSRNKSSHTYNEKTADEIFKDIINLYYPAFDEFRKYMQAKLDNSENDIFNQK